MSTTTVQLKKETVEKLKEIGKKGETYNNIVSRAINGYITYKELKGAQDQKRVGYMGMATEDVALQKRGTKEEIEGERKDTLAFKEPKKNEELEKIKKQAELNRRLDPQDKVEVEM